MKLIITRHGETKENKTKQVMGQLDGKLSKVGIAQAEKLAKRLKNEKIDAIYASDLSRAADTARKIAQFHENVPFTFTKELREMHFGELQGKCKADLSMPENQSAATIRTRHGEKLEDLHARAENFLHEILSRHKNDTVLLVCHKDISKAMMTVIFGKKPKEVTTIESLHNTSVSTFDIDEDKNHKIICFNCVKHLKE